MRGMCRRLFGSLMPTCVKSLKFGKKLTGKCNRGWNFHLLAASLMVGSLLCFLAVVGSSYYYMFPSHHPLVYDNVNPKSDSSIPVDSLSKKCDLWEGKWVVDESYPLYNSSKCPFVERGFDCLRNGRRDKGYLKWRWKPRDCEIPKFDASASLAMLRGKRVVFVGDSLSRTQWESMICMLMTGVEDEKSVYEVNGNEITKQIRHLGVQFRSFNSTVEYYRSPFLVQPGKVSKDSPKRVKTALKLDQLDGISREWIDSDILVFNSGHWWTPTKLFDIQGLVFSDGWEIEAWIVDKHCLQNCISYMAILG